MGDHVILNVGRLLPSEIQKTTKEEKPFIESSSNNKHKEENNITSEDAEPLIQKLECRICQEEDNIKNLEVPCACSGSLKVYKPDCTATLDFTQTRLQLISGWNVTGALDLHDPRVLAMAAAQRRFLEAEYDEYASADASSVAFCCNAVLIILLLRQMLMTLVLEQKSMCMCAYNSAMGIRARQMCEG